MSASIISSLALTSQQIVAYGGTSLLIAGTIGEFLLGIVFLSLRTFRQSSCAFYLTVMAIVNVGQLLTGLLSRVMITGYAIDWTERSLFFCKFRLFSGTAFAQISFTCISLAIMDQYFATCSRLRWQQWSNIKIAHRLTILFIGIWLLHDIPYLIFFNQIYSISTNTTICTGTNTIFTQYRIYFVAPVTLGFLPVCSTLFFSIMAYRNIQSIAYRTVPLVRRELDKQLTNIVLVQVPFHLVSIIPYTVMNVLTSNPNWISDRVIWARIQFASTITSLLFYVAYISPFYICISVSDRFRRQLIFVLRKPFCTQWKPPNTVSVNQVAPEP